MRGNKCSLAIVGWALVAGAGDPSAPALKSAGTCHRETIEGELNAGQAFSQEIGSGLKLYFQPIAAGWILRVLPVQGPAPEHDYAEVATPPYQSVTPLSISTDFAFRSQDAVGWNPRHFRFATSAARFARLQALYGEFTAVGMPASPEAQEALSRELASTAEGTLTILDARLVPGTADQWRMAGAVASHFGSTAHTLVEEPGGSTSALGRLVWLKFRVTLDLPHGFATSPVRGAPLRVLPQNCGRPGPT